MPEAAVVVGTHGSTLTDVHWARRCTDIEIVHPTYPGVVLYAPADALGRNYWYVVGTGGAGSLTRGSACEPQVVARTLTRGRIWSARGRRPKP